ncbi:DNA-directed RNA polymerase I and III 14 KDA polypeptide [Xylona heveae TC161]|uniref:DNA-directed RNA polymerases I and III subunit RPAC2 n=1 Tax=Xylona heveae (strain CBS 132557 / TC161) TaxID=1328760 RepID=A0A165GVL7_XYLHT|nr:DNA-directed RNA polymerase I and III 14 KDA polypeptide [Xylona heveae TC161]KZF22652.1 DNA-directed RNA polymerase I and III 14 KDA polypeptide [Xylona heveae TC161]
MPSGSNTAEDQHMADAAMEHPPAPEPYIDLADQRIRVLPGSTETAASFEFEGEDHTLGNALRYIIMKNPDVEFCGYSIPHPSEAKMNIRIQTYENTTAFDALEKGLDDLMDLCDVVVDKFAAAKSAIKPPH